MFLIIGWLSSIFTNISGIYLTKCISPKKIRQSLSSCSICIYQTCNNDYFDVYLTISDQTLLYYCKYKVYIYIISSHSSRVFLNNFYRIDINKENELAKMMLQLCRIACSRHKCISFSPRSIDLSPDGIGALELN